MDRVCGIGCRVATLPNGKLHFVEIHSWGGAALSGHVFVGDELITVDGIPVASSEDARRVILGKLGTELTLGISRAGIHRSVTVVRAACAPSGAAVWPVLAAAGDSDSAPAKPVVDAGTSSPSSATSGDQASAEAPGTALCRPDSRLNDRDANDAAASPSQVPVQLEASEPSGPSSSATLSSVNCAGAPAKSGDFDLKEKVRIVTLIGGLDAKRQGEMYGIIQKYQPMLLAASDDVVEIQVESLDNATLMALLELCEPNSLELKTHRDNVAAGGCCAAAAAHEPSEGSSVCLERGPPDAAASAECEVEGELSIPEGCDALSLVQWYVLDCSHANHAESPPCAGSVLRGTIQPSSAIFRVLKQVHPGLNIKSRAMNRLQKMLTWFAFQTLKGLDQATRMQDFRYLSEDHSDSDVAKALSAFDDALARVLVGELHRHAMNEARKATKRCAAAGCWGEVVRSDFRGVSARKIAGLQFDFSAAGKCSRAMGLPLSKYMVAPFSAVLEYLCAELLELGGNACRCRLASTVINVADIEICVKEDTELAKTFEIFSANEVISIFDTDDNSKTMRRSKAVAKFLFRAAESSLPECSSIFFLETFLVEAACACASQKLSSSNVKLLVKHLTSLCSDEKFQYFKWNSFCALLISALEWVSVFGSEVVVPFAADHHLTHLRLRLSSSIRTVCQISDIRSVVLCLFHTAKMMCGWSISKFQQYQYYFIPQLCGLLLMSEKFDPEELLDVIFAEIIGGTASFGSVCDDSIQSLPALDADSISKLCRMSIDISAFFTYRSNQTKNATHMEVPSPRSMKPQNWAKMLHKSSALQSLASAFDLQHTFHESIIISVPSNVFDAFSPHLACKTTQIYIENSKLFDKLLLEQKQLENALAALNSSSCGEAASAIILTELERKKDVLRKWSELRSLMTAVPHSAEAILELQKVCDDHNLTLLHGSFSPFLGAGCVTLQDGVRLSVSSALVLYLLETVDSAPMSADQIAQHLNMPQELVVESMAILAKHGYVSDAKLVSPLEQGSKCLGSERCCAPCMEHSSCAPCDSLSNPKEFVTICHSILRVMLQNGSVPEVSIYGMLTQHLPSQVSHTLAQLRTKGVISLKNGHVSFSMSASPDCNGPNDIVPKVNLVIDSIFSHFSGTRFKGSRWLFFDRTLKDAATHAPGLDFAASSVSEASSCSRAFSSDEIQAYLTRVIQTIESCVDSPSVAFAEVLSDFVKCGGCAAKTLLLHLQKQCTTPLADIPEEKGDIACSICLEEPSSLRFPCCANQLCEQCFKIHYFAQNATSRTDSTPTVGALVQAASLHSDLLVDYASPIAFRCPFLTCNRVLSRKYFRTLLSNLHFFSNEMNTALLKAAVSLCSSMRPSTAYALCSAPLPDGVQCSKFHVGVVPAACVRCHCGVHSSISLMKHAAQDFKTFTYLNLTVSQVVDWFSDNIRSKFESSLSERIELDPDSLSSGRYKMCPRCKHGPIEHINCDSLNPHFGESKGSWMIDNRCEVCRFFSTEAADWPVYNAEISCEAQGYLGQLHKDVTDSVKIVENFLQDMSWYLTADKWWWSLDLSRYVTNLLMARSSLILFFIDSLSSYNPDAHRGNKNHSRDTLNADWSQNDCCAQLLMQSMNIRYKPDGPDLTLHGYKLVFRICCIVQSTAKALTPERIDVVKKIVTQSARYKNLHSLSRINDILDPVERMLSSQSKFASFLSTHASCFSNRHALETASILLCSGCFVIENRVDGIFKLRVLKCSPLNEIVVALKACGTGITPLHILTLLAHSLQPSTAIEITSRSKEDMDIELDQITRRLVKQYCQSRAVASMGGRKLMESMAAASQLVMTSTSSVSNFLEHMPITDTIMSDSSDDGVYPTPRDGQTSSEPDTDGL